MEDTTKHTTLLRLWVDHQEFIESEYPVAMQVLGKREAKTKSTFANYLIQLGIKSYEEIKKGVDAPEKV